MVREWRPINHSFSSGGPLTPVLHVVPLVIILSKFSPGLFSVFLPFAFLHFFRGFYYFFQSCLITLPHPHAVTCTVRHVSFRRGQKRAVWGRLAPESRDYCCATTILVIRALLSTFTGGRRKKKKVCAASSVMPPRRSRPRSSYDITSHFRVVYLSCLCLSCWRRDER